jgi:hypothetical protein
MSAVYVWRDNEVQVIKQQVLTNRAEPLGLLNLFILDDFHHDKFPRYGMFKQHPFNPETSDWQHIPIEEFPPLFRMHLLLMGVG